MAPKTAVIIDDEPDIRETLEFSLSRRGFDVDTAVDGLEGLEKAKRLPPDFMILDVMLPGCNGYEVSRMLKEWMDNDPQARPFPILLLIGALVLVPVFQVPFGGSARASQFSTEDGQLVLDSLLKNVYRAFDFRDEEDVYDKLAICVSGELLADLYLEQRRSLVVEQAGGAQAKVEGVEVREAAARRLDDGRGGYAVRAKWSAGGTVGHWGHIHQRRNQYEAVFTVKPMDGAWKITEIELVSEARGVERRRAAEARNQRNRRLRPLRDSVSNLEREIEVGDGSALQHVGRRKLDAEGLSPLSF